MSIEVQFETYTGEDLEKEILFSYLEVECETWLEARAKADRAGGLDANLNKKRDACMTVIHDDLAKLIELPGVRYERTES